MLRKVLSGVMLAMFLISILALTFQIESVKASPSTVHVDDDNVSGPWNGTEQYPYQNITSGLEHAIAGDTVFVHNGTYNENIVVNKSLTLLGENKSLTIIEGVGGEHVVVDITANNVAIREFTINKSSKMGIRVGYNNIGYNNTVIQNNKIIDCGDRGIELQDSNSANITGNNITSTQDPDGETPDWDGILLVGSNDNTIQGNIIINLADLGIGCAASSNNTIQDNMIDEIFGRSEYYAWEWHIHGYGIQLASGSQYNSIISNNISNIKSKNSSFTSRCVDINGTSLHNIVRDNNVFNGGIGINLHTSTSNYNNISGNNITANDYGIKLAFGSSNNSIYHNYLVNNSIQASGNGTTNFWDDGYPSGGNYWSDYDGNDTYYGPYQNVTGSDGIGDTNYTINENNVDYYPLMVPYELVNLTIRAYGVGELTGVKMWIDTEEFETKVEEEACVGSHMIEAEHGFVRIIGGGPFFYKYKFDHWEDMSTANPRSLNLDQEKTITAYYDWTIICWK